MNDKHLKDIEMIRSIMERSSRFISLSGGAGIMAGYVEVKKEFVGEKPKTTYRVTQKGKSAFNEHLQALEKLIKGK